MSNLQYIKNCVSNDHITELLLHGHTSYTHSNLLFRKIKNGTNLCKQTVSYVYLLLAALSLARGLGDSSCLH
uniref:Uncharacterized protein n=1 Tax=Anguilla anguilla TaxID=7936 RepID=A0A0E9WJY3_ANGAN